MCISSQITFTFLGPSPLTFSISTTPSGVLETHSSKAGKLSVSYICLIAARTDFPTPGTAIKSLSDNESKDSFIFFKLKAAVVKVLYLNGFSS